MIFFASASANQNDLVEKEIIRSGGRDIRVTRSGIEFEGSLAVGYNFALHTHLATRLLMLLAREDGVESTDDLYERSLAMPWEDWVSPEKTFAVTETISDCRWIVNSHFAALRLKDAIVERCRENFDGERPNVDRETPDVCFHLHVRGDLVSWFVDFAGRAIFRRGYRAEYKDVAMGEYLAATVLMRSPWYKDYSEGRRTVLLDPFCGSGTILIEAALMATHTPPGLVNTGRFAFFNLPIHDEEVWQDVFDKAEAEITDTNMKFTGWDIDPEAVEMARRNAEKAGMSHLIEFDVKDFGSVTEEDALRLTDGIEPSAGADGGAAKPHGEGLEDGERGEKAPLGDGIATLSGEPGKTRAPGSDASAKPSGKDLEDGERGEKTPLGDGIATLSDEPGKTLAPGSDASAKTGTDSSSGVRAHIVTDPPYGVRLEFSRGDITDLYRTIGRTATKAFPGWTLSILSAEKELLGYVDMKPNRTNFLMNGGLECQLAHYYIFSRAERAAMEERAKKRREERLSAPLSNGTQMVLNRLRKNISSLGSEMERQGVSCYRLYDADMPEYSAAIDIYEGSWIVLSEYAAPSSIRPEDAARRFDELVLATEIATGIPLENIFIKKRERMRGKSQYEKHREPSESHFYVIRENGHKFRVNFQDYLDTGIFLDHRPIRRFIEENSRDKRFLNLFCYTSSATVHAAAGGALSTVSVDASATYLDWSMKNMAMNGFSGMNHFYYRSDSIEYLRENHDRFDLIFCDPPTFSNSKNRGTFDIQRDHGYLIRSCMRHLDRGGTLVFSTNYTRFRLFAELYEEFDVADITPETIGADFSRNPKIHQCYLIRHKQAVKAKRVYEKADGRKIVARRRTAY